MRIFPQGGTGATAKFQGLSLPFSKVHVVQTHLHVQLVLLAAGKHVAAAVAHESVVVGAAAAAPLDRPRVIFQVPRGAERLAARRANGARVPVRGLAVCTQRARLHERLRAERAPQRRGHRFRPRPVHRGHVRGQRLPAAARHAARAAPVPQVPVDVQLAVPAVRERLLAVAATVVLGHRARRGFVARSDEFFLNEFTFPITRQPTTETYEKFKSVTIIIQRYVLLVSECSCKRIEY